MISYKAHSGCYDEIDKHCDFGKFSHLMLPPFAVSLANIALWRRMSKEHRENCKLRFVPELLQLTA